MESYSIVPILGLKSNVSQNDPSLFQAASETIAITHCIDSLNVDYQRVRNACSKSAGKVKYNPSAIASPDHCQGLFQTKSGTTITQYFFDNGRFYYLDGALAFQQVNTSDSVLFDTSALELFSMIQYGDYIIFSDLGTHTPYIWKTGETYLTKLISSGTEYTFKYLEMFQGRIIGAYSDQTNGDLELRWTARLPSVASGTTFASTNQLYKPDEDSITGIKRMGNNACVVYGNKSISQIGYYSSSYSVFGITSVVNSQGAASNNSIVDVGGRHFLFNKHYGFCEYRGGTEFPYNGRPISEPIENRISGIYDEYFSEISGCFNSLTNEVAWVVPLNGASSPTHILYYHIIDDKWRIEDKASRAIDVWSVTNGYTWNDLISDLGGAGALWSAIAAGTTWSAYANVRSRFVCANNSGYVYTVTGENDDGSAIDAYRIEPILDFGSSEDKDLLLEIWFTINYRGNYSITCYHRSGMTPAECENASWTSLGTVTCYNSSEAVIYTDKMNRFHQIKWGNANADERVAVNKIEFKYIRQGRY